MPDPFAKWATSSPRLSRGVIVGADLTQEWLLPWWWERYRRHNTLPVFFVDFGMSQEGKAWCRERGELHALPLSDAFVAERSEISPPLVEEMERVCGKQFWPSRTIWFKKPFACLLSPFSQGLWIDLDCEVCGCLDPLFSLSQGKLGMVREAFDNRGANQQYNAGLILFPHGAQCITEWADRSVRENHLFRGDQDVLNALIQERNFPLVELPEIYNWSRLKKANPEAVVVHWHGPHGKDIIAYQMTCTTLEQLYGDPSS